MQLLDANPFAMQYETSMKKQRTRKPPICDAIAVEINERSQALAVAGPNVVIETRGVGCKCKEEESVV
jgi:hypothetical protein